jgi:zinc-ribbon domain/Protein of unknown function (DUF2628)
MYCPSCGKDVTAGAQFCQNCGAAVPSQAPQPGAQAATVTPAGTGRFAYLSEYWQKVFGKFDQSPTRMQTYWNWPAFFFGPIWYLVKGMPAKGLLYVLIMATGIGWLFLLVYAGLYGAWDYYLKEAQGKQLW